FVQCNRPSHRPRQGRERCRVPRRAWRRRPPRSVPRAAVLTGSSESPRIWHNPRREPGELMKRFILLVAALSVSCAPQPSADKNVAAWEQRAQNVTIVRDNWGIAHVRGKSDADAVFGAIYAQAED